MVKSAEVTGSKGQTIDFTVLLRYIRVLLVQCSIYKVLFPEQVATGKAAIPGLEYPQHHLYLGKPIPEIFSSTFFLELNTKRSISRD